MRFLYEGDEPQFMSSKAQSKSDPDPELNQVLNLNLT